MRKIFILLILLISTLIIFSCSTDDEAIDVVMTRSYGIDKTSSICFNMERPEDAYWFPVQPGTDEWASLHNKGLDEVYKTLRIPSSTLSKMSTEGLVQTFMDFPFNANFLGSSSTYFIWFSKDLKEGRVISDIYKELKGRKDRGDIVMSFYKAYVYNKEHRYPGVIFQVLSMLASVDGIYSSLSDSEKKEFVQIVLQKHEMLLTLEHDYSFIVSFLVGRLMQSAKYKPLLKLIKDDKVLNNYIENLDFEFNDFESIISLAYNYINS